MKTHSLVIRIQGLDRRVADHGFPASSDELAAMQSAIGCALPDDYRAVMGLLGRIYIEGGTRLYLHRCDDDNGGPFERLPGVVMIATDGGDYGYYFDPLNALGYGAFAIFFVDFGTLTFESSSLVGRDLGEVVDRVLAGESFYEYPSLGDRWTEDHRGAALRDLSRLLPDLGVDDVTIDLLHFRTLVPAVLTTRRDIVIDGIPCAADEEIHVTPDCRVSYATLSQDHRIERFLCLGGSLVVLGAGGSPHRFTLAENVSIEGVLWKHGAEVTLPDEHLDTLSGTPAEPLVIHGIPCASAHVVLDAHRDVRSATLARDTCVDGVPLPAGTWFERHDGKLFAVRAPRRLRIGGRTFAANETHYL